MSRITRLSVVFAMLTALLVASFQGMAQDSQYHPIATPEFEQVWQRNDLPVQNLVVARTWTWGPGGITPLMQEPYVEAPDGLRDVQYFEKSRMEMPWIAGGDPESPWYITQGHLARELITGQLQLGDNLFEQHHPSQRPAAGDPDDPDGPTYATMGEVMDIDPRETGSVITQTLDRHLNFGENHDLAVYGVTDEYYVPETNHNIASVFWSLMNSTGLVYENGEYVDGTVFQNPFYGIGLPLTEAYWAWVKVDHVMQNVLIQCFERRCLTYAPDNPEGWETESGNIGLHYYHWRYHEIDRSTVGAMFTVTPEHETNVVGDTHELTVTVFDYDGTPKDGVPVTAEVTLTTGEGQNHLGVTMTGNSGEDGDGVVIVSYVGTETGNDTITVSVAGVIESQTVLKTWVEDDSGDPPSPPPPPPPSNGGDDDDGDTDPPIDEPGDPSSIALAHDGPDTNVVGSPHTVVATVEDGAGEPVEDGTTIQFQIDGPNASHSGTADTTNGIASFTYTGTITGADDITASWNNVTSNTVTKTWIPGEPASFEMEHLGIESNPPIPQNVVYLEPHTVVGTVEDTYGNAVPGVEVDFSISGPNYQVDGTTDPQGNQANRGVTDDDGKVRFTYTGTSSGQDTISGVVVDDQSLTDSLDKIWLALRISMSHVGDAENHVGVEHTVRATVEYREHNTDNWLPYQGALVGFEIQSGGANDDVESDSSSTDSSGEAEYSYTGTNTGSDDIVGTILIDTETATPLSDSVTKEWFEWSISLAHGQDQASTNQIDTSHTVVATVVDQNGTEVDGVEVEFSIIDGPHEGDFSHTGDSGDFATGQVAFTYTGTEYGVDTIQAEIIDGRVGDSGDSDAIQKTWVDVQISFNPEDATNPYFTSEEIEYIEGLVVGQLNDPTDEERDDAIAAFWQTHTGHSVPNRHTVEISVSQNGVTVESGQVEVLVVFDVGGEDEELVNQTLNLTDGVATLTYDAHDEGVDTISATYGVNSGSTTKTWVPFLESDYDQEVTYVFLSVDNAGPTVEDTVDLTAEVLDQFGQPVADVDVVFTSNRQVDPLGTVSTGVNGEAAVLTDHNHTVAESELITATEQENDNSDSLTINWSAGAPFSIVLSHTLDFPPISSEDTNVAGDSHTVNALVRDEDLNWVAQGTVITFTITGTNASESGTAQVGANGVATFTYDSDGSTGTDTIVATWGTAPDDVTSNTLTKHWIAGDPASIVLAHSDDDFEEPETSDTNVIGTDEEHTVYAEVRDGNGNLVADGTSVSFTVTDPVDHTTVITTGTGTTTSGIASFTYDAPASERVDRIVATWGDEPDQVISNALEKIWEEPEPAGIQFVNQYSGALSGSNESRTIPVPSTIQNGTYEGQFMLLHITHSGGDDVNFSTPAGWNFLFRADEDSDVGHAVYWKISGSSEASQINFQFNDDVYMVWGILIYDGVDTTNPVIAFGSNGNDSDTLTAPALTVNQDAYLVGLYGISDSYALTLHPNNPMALRHTQFVNSELYMLAADQEWTSTGSTGTRVVNAADDAEWVASLIALRPAS